jgi:hypothetical protein
MCELTKPTKELERRKTMVTELKRKFNELLIRRDRGEIFLDNPNIPLEQKEKWADTFKDILRQMNELAAAIEATGHKLTDEEVLEGFNFSSPEEGGVNIE